MTRWLWISMTLTAAALAGTAYVNVFLYDQLPPSMPVHWDLHGEPNAWMPRDQIWKNFILLPIVMAGMNLLTIVLPRISPRQFEVDRFREAYEYIMTLVVGLLGYFQFVILWVSLHPEWSTGRLMAVGGFLFFALLGNVLGQVRRNFWMGVRTPWTLASERVWIDTHRVSAWLFLAAGIIGSVAVSLGASLAACFIGLIIVALLPVVYSLLLYKRLERQGKL